MRAREGWKIWYTGRKAGEERTAPEGKGKPPLPDSDGGVELYWSWLMLMRKGECFLRPAGNPNPTPNPCVLCGMLLPFKGGRKDYTTVGRRLSRGLRKICKHLFVNMAAGRAGSGLLPLNHGRTGERFDGLTPCLTGWRAGKKLPACICLVLAPGSPCMAGCELGWGEPYGASGALFTRL